MKIIVCIKQVPDIAETNRVKTDPYRGTLIREGIPSIVNPFDEYAVEESIRIRERYGGKVTVLSMGPPQASDALIKCLSMGADAAILLTDKAFAGSDTLATAYILAAAIRKIGEFDLVLCGQQAIDGDTGQVGPGIAENLHIPQITYVNSLEIEGRKLRAQREIEAGYETVECKLPALVTVIKGINEPRIPTFSSISEALEKEILTWTSRDLEVNLERLGLDGSPTKVIRVWAPSHEVTGRILKGEPEEVAHELVGLLEGEGII